MMPSGPEVLIIAVIIILLFGSRMFVSWAKGLGETIREMKKVQKELEE